MIVYNHNFICINLFSQIGFGSTGLYDGDIYDGPSNKLVIDT